MLRENHSKFYQQKRIKFDSPPFYGVAWLMTPAFSTIIHNFEILKHSLLGAVGSDFFVGTLTMKSNFIWGSNDWTIWTVGFWGVDSAPYQLFDDEVSWNLAYLDGTS